MLHDTKTCSIILTSGFVCRTTGYFETFSAFFPVNYNILGWAGRGETLTIFKHWILTIYEREFLPFADTSITCFPSVMMKKNSPVLEVGWEFTWWSNLTFASGITLPLSSTTLPWAPVSMTRSIEQMLYTQQFSYQDRSI